MASSHDSNRSKREEEPGGASPRFFVSVLPSSLCLSSTAACPLSLLNTGLVPFGACAMPCSETLSTSLSLSTLLCQVVLASPFCPLFCS